MKFYIKIQSVNDLITNSSSEVFTVHTDTPVEVIRGWFNNTLRLWGYSDEDIHRDSTIRGNIYEERPGIIVISYGVMCNVNESIYGLLAETFGERNVRVEY